MKLGDLVALKEPYASDDDKCLFGMVVGIKKDNRGIDIQIMWYTTKEDSRYFCLNGKTSNEAKKFLKIISEGISP